MPGTCSCLFWVKQFCVDLAKNSSLLEVAMSAHDPLYIIQETHHAIVTKFFQKCMQAGGLL